MEIFRYAKSEDGLSREEIRQALLESLAGRALRHALIIPPDYTRFHSNAGFITNVYYHAPHRRYRPRDLGQDLRNAVR